VSWVYRFSESARRELKDLDKSAQVEILTYLDARIATTSDPRRFGKPLRAKLAGLWRYRIRSFRLICLIQDSQLLVFVVRVGHRKNIYE
jgi:mRNA interferase RelE/StbE